MPEPNREKAIFEQALDCAGPEDRAAFLQQACVGNDALRERLEALLAADDAAPQFLPNTPGTGSVLHLANSPVAEGPGSVIGRYKLLEPIGEGGFGVVYLAEQLEPVRRRVALKLVKSGMDSKQVIGRFEAERQALALMNHPNIAQVFDAGTTPAGRPFFVMELVNGLPITRFCEERPLDLEARLRLFIAVCGAVQHAHQKGVIHRDLKPSNILVTLHGDQPVPKVIDFGIAKALEQPLTDKTVFTQFQQFLGTPAYVSPEQAALSGLDVDTRSDIYSLGVLLYELLTGTTPFDAKALMSQGIDALRRTIREQEPPRPSTRLTRELARLESERPRTSQALESARAHPALGSARASRAASGASPEAIIVPPAASGASPEAPGFADAAGAGKRPDGVFGGAPKTAREARALPAEQDSVRMARADPTRKEASRTALGLPAELRARIATVRGDLDWIVLKALAKDPDRRYATVNGLAVDLQRFLNHDPVSAVAPTLTYQLVKLYRRNRKEAVIVLASAVLLLGAAVVGLALAVRAHRAEALAVREAAAARQAAEFVWQELFKPLTPWQHTNRSVTLREAFDRASAALGGRFVREPLAEAAFRRTFGKTYFGLSEWTAAETNLLRALELRRAYAPQPDETTAALVYDLADLRAFQNHATQAEALYTEAATLRAHVLGPYHSDTLTASAKAAHYRAAGLPYAEGVALFEETAETLRRRVGTDTHIFRATLNRLGEFQARHDQVEKAADLFDQTHRLAVAADGPASSDALWSLQLLAEVRARQGDLDAAGQSLRQLLALRKQVNGAGHFFTQSVRVQLAAQVLVPQGRYVEAAEALRPVAAAVRVGQPALEPAFAQARQALLTAWETNGGGPEFDAFRQDTR